MRIKQLTLTDFRAFPGPSSASFDFDAKNLLIYGENGAGKSSVFHALREFFALKPSASLTSFKNVFSSQALDAVRIKVEFNDGKNPAIWNVLPADDVISRYAANAFSLNGANFTEHHPSLVFGGSDQRVVQAALRRACLDYRALLDTNYKHDNNNINLFEIAHERLLADFPVIVSGGQQKTIGELWRSVEQTSSSKPCASTSGRLSRSLPYINAINACTEFNAGFKQALAALQPHISTLLSKLIGADVTVAPFNYAGVTYTAPRLIRDREIQGRQLILDVSYRNHKLTKPQHFLNEARLSAVALAMYLAGRLACTPTSTPNALKLLVLDDVLIGLDHRIDYQC
jgi:AAA domain